MTDSLLDYVLAHLRDRRGQWGQISKDTGIAMSTLQNIESGRIKDPRLRKIETLARYFRARTAAVENNVNVGSPA